MRKIISQLCPITRDETHSRIGSLSFLFLFFFLVCLSSHSKTRDMQLICGLYFQNALINAKDFSANCFPKDNGDVMISPLLSERVVSSVITAMD